jgi:FAD synthetase
MSLEKLVSKYIASAERVFDEIEVAENPISLNVRDFRAVLDSAKAYLDDAKYYRNSDRFETSLASIAYCEGLLDALKMLGAVRFEWTAKKEKRNGR